MKSSVLPGRAGNSSAGVPRRTVLSAGAMLGAGSLLAGAANVFAQKGDTIKIGSARALTGLVASSFAPLYVSVKIAVEEINAAGGVLGRALEVIEADDESSPAKEPAVMRRLIDGGAQALLGPVGSSHTLAAVPTTTAAKMIHAGGGWAEELADGVKYPYHYQFTYNTGHQGEAIARQIVEKLKLKKVGILQENSGLGESGGAATTRALKKFGLEPVAVEVYPTTATDLKVYLAKLRAAGTEAIVLWNSPAQGMLLTATEAASISGVCTVFAESEVINHLSNSVSPENIMLGAGMSLMGRSVSLLKRVKIEPQLTLVGGILRWGRIAQAIAENLKIDVNVPEGDLPQYCAALGCAILAHQRLLAQASCASAATGTATMATQPIATRPAALTIEPGRRDTMIS